MFRGADGSERSIERSRSDDIEIHSCLHCSIAERSVYSRCSGRDFATPTDRARIEIFTKTVFTLRMRRAREFGSVRNAHCGAVSFIQRFDSALRLNLHIHSFGLDGIYAAGDDDQPHFQVLPALDDEEIARLTGLLAERARKFLERRGLGANSDPGESDPLVHDQPWLAEFYAASVLGRAAYGGSAGEHIVRRGDRIDPENIQAFSGPRCASIDGFSLHANVAVHAGDRARLEHLARYCARPPVAVERLEQLDGGRLLYRFKRAWRNGTTHVVLEPLQMLEKLAALIPAPRAHLVRYAGILAPAAKWRPLIVPSAPPEVECAVDCRVPEQRSIRYWYLITAKIAPTEMTVGLQSGCV